jgi:hypothetical protein
MKDLNLGHAINVMAWSALTLSVVACGGKNKEEEEEEEEDPVATYSEALMDCDGSAFNSQFDSLRECENEIEYYQEYYAEYYGRACGRAFSALVECTSKVLERSCSLDNAYDRCGEEFSDFEDECGDYDYYYY